MIKYLKRIQIINIIILFLLIINPIQAKSPKILDVIDGDTLKISAPFLPLPLEPTLLLRISGIDTPEIHSPKCQIEYLQALKAKEFTKNVIDTAKSYKIIINKWDKYGGRVDGDVVINSTKKLSTILLKSEFAKPYQGDKKQSWCDI